MVIILDIFVSKLNEEIAVITFAVPPAIHMAENVERMSSLAHILSTHISLFFSVFPVEKRADVRMFTYAFRTHVRDFEHIHTFRKIEKF